MRRVRKIKGFVIKYKTLLLLALLGIITFGLYARNISYDFAYTDDFFEIVNNPLVKPSSPVTELFNINNFHFYTPLKHLPNYLLNLISYNNPHISHLLSNTIHVLNVLLCFLIVLLISKRYSIAFFTALAFGVAPAVSPAVNELAARGHILSAFWALFSTYLYLFSKLPGAKFSQTIHLKNAALVSFILGLLTWPTIILLPLFFLSLDLTRMEKPFNTKALKKILITLFPFFAASFVAGVLNFYISYLSGALLGNGTAFDNDLLFSVTLLGAQSVYKLPLILSRYILYCFYPPYVDIIFSPFLPAFGDFKLYYISHFLILAVALALYYKAIKINKTYAAFFALSAFFLAPGIIFVYKTELLSLRYLYLPSIGLFAVFFIFIDYCVRLVSKRVLKYALYFAVSLWLVFSAANTFQRKQAWQNPQTLLYSLINSHGINEVWGWFLAVNWESDLEQQLFHLQTARKILEARYSVGYEVFFDHLMQKLEFHIAIAKAAIDKKQS